ncbi:chitinase [Aeromonas phage pAEv1810]|uniref:chitinase n=1 Tax=Aeromonas phage pAEv1810 TaxID=2908744 RepID=UPI0023298491|nr:chitinase [Aeromonas phage pAEv1810]UIS25187.1 putative endolysin [Aeromonas phage pAEv1810]
MASDTYDLDWDDDPFGGDIDFDMDFDMDPYAKKGFVGGMASGFLSGIVDETVGSGEARMRSLRTILPKSFSTALDRVSWAGRRFDELKTEFKEENASSVKSLQSIAGHLSKKMGERMPSSITNELENFSQKDFSSWEKLGSYETGGLSIEETSEYDVTAALDRSLEAQEGMFSALGETLNTMSAHVGGMITASISSGNRQLVNIESGMRDLVNYQRNVQLRMDQAKLSLLAKTYVSNVKYYKFMEKGIHTEIAELKKIQKASMMSDYQKTSNFTASKEFMRNKLFNTVGKRVGGLTGLIKDKFGKSARQEGYQGGNFALEQIADMLDMSDGMPMSKGMIGDLIGKQLGSMFVSNIPYFFERGKGKDWINKLAAKNPKEAKQFQEMFGKLTNFGNKASYASTSGVGLINYLAEDYEAMDEMQYLDYQDYLDQLPPGKKPIPKAIWVAKNAATNKAKASVNSFMSEITKSRGTQYTLNKRNVKDLNNPGIWKETNNITLNEVIPGLLSKILTSTEGIRTGEKNIESVSYNYMRGQFQTDSEKRISVKADLMPYGDFSRYAQAALEMVDGLDTERTLSPGARKALAQQIAKDVDQEKGFNPFYYLGDIPNVSGSHQKEIHAVMKRHFGLNDQDVSEFKSAKGFDKLKRMTDMRSNEGNERLNVASATAANMKDLFPNVAERIDMLRSTGNEQLLRDLGVIYTEAGVEKVNMNIFHERLGQFMENPNNPQLKGMFDNTSKKPVSDGKGGFIVPKSPTGSSSTNNTFNELNSSISDLSAQLGRLIDNTSKVDTERSSGPRAYFDTHTGEVVSNIDKIATSTSNMDLLFTELLSIVKDGKLFSKQAKSQTEERQADRYNFDVVNRLKKILPTNILGKGFEMVMQNQPLILGSILGGVSSHFIQNPILAAAAGVGGIALGALVQHWGKTDYAEGVGDEPSDDEDILDENGNKILTSAKLKAGDYYDAVKRRVIKTWRDIKGPLFDVANKVTITVKELGGKIFGADGRAVVLSGITKIKDAAVGAYNFIDPLTRIKSVMEMGKNLIYQQDVFVKGEKTPRLRAIKFKEGEYSIEDSTGSIKPIWGWNEINGPVYNSEGNEVISQVEFDQGLITATGQKVRAVGSAASGLAGTAAGLARSGLDNILGKFGYNRPQGDTEGSGIGKSGQSSNRGVERRLDRIYAILSQKFGIDIPDNFDGESDPIGSPIAKGLRLNSLEDKIRQAKAEKQEKVQDSIIDIAEGMKEPKEGEKTEKQGVFGKLFSLMGGMGDFAMRLIKNPIGTLGGLIMGSLVNSGKRLASIGTMLFSGVLGVASPIFKIMKWGFTALTKATMAKTAASGLGDALGGAGRGGMRGKIGGVLSKLGGRGKMMAALLGTGAVVGGGMYAADAFGSEAEPTDGDVYEDGKDGNGPKLTTMEKVVDTTSDFFLPTLALKTAKEFLLPKAATDFIENKGVFWAPDGTFFTDRREAQAYIDGTGGVSTKEIPDSLQRRIRYAQYGIKSIDGNLAKRVSKLEQALIPHLAIANNRASFSQSAPVAQILQQFAKGGDSVPFDQVHTWFNARFKPVFLLYAVAVSIGRHGDINEFDRKESYEVTLLCERVRTSMGTLDPFPYEVQVQIDPREGILNRVMTENLVSSLLSELRKKYPTPEEEFKLETDVERRNRVLNEKTPDGLAGWFSNSYGDRANKLAQEEVDRKFQTPQAVREIDISDLHKDANTAIDAFTMVRLGVYGNIDNMPWRVDAVLRLERYCEDLINTLGTEAVFSGNPTRVFNLFKAQFRIETTNGETNWHLWFQNRFLPVLQQYVKEMKRLRNQLPKQGWRSLSDTNKAKLARFLSETRVIYQQEEVTVWDVKASPFENSNSGSWPDRVEKYLKSLDAKATKARLKEPELEDERSLTYDEKASGSKVNYSQVQANTNALFDKVYGKNRNVSAGNVGIYGGGTGNSFTADGRNNNGLGYGTNYNLQGGNVNLGWSDTFNPEFQKLAGDDKGIKMDPAQGEQLLLNHLLKAGVTDKKMLALALAMAKKETGNYSATVENTNWSAPTLKKYFRNIPDMATAEKVAALSPAERAMYVYGKAPKGPTLGNTKPEDGWLYRGRGLFQLTGKANYEKFKQETGIDVVSNPRIVSEDPNVMAESAVRFLLNSKAMRSIAQTGDFETAMRGINGGNPVPGSDERRQYYQEYLDRLNRGDISVPDTGEQGAVQISNEQAQLPSVPDSNVPPDHIDGNKAVNPDAKEDINSLMNAADTAKVSNKPVSPTSTPTASPASKPKVPTPPPSIAAPQPPSNTATNTPAVNPSSVMKTPTKEVPVELKLPDGPLAVNDEANTAAMARLITSVDTLNEGINRLAKQQSGVRMN